MQLRACSYTAALPRAARSITAPRARLKPLQRPLERAPQKWQPGASPCKGARGRGQADPFTRHALSLEQFQPLTLASSSGLNGVCFDAACAAAADRVFLAVTAVPLVGLLASILYALWPVEKHQVRSLFHIWTATQDTLQLTYGGLLGIAVSTSPLGFLLMCGLSLIGSLTKARARAPPV